MRPIKTFGLAAVTATAAMALVGASSAMAQEHPALGLCLANEVLLCKTPLAPPPGGSILLLLKAKSPKLLASNGFEEVCENSKVSFNVPGANLDQNPILGTLKEFTFTGNCKTCTTVTAEELPYAATWSMATEGGESGELTSPLKTKLSGCPLGVTCVYSTGGAKLTADDGPSGILVKAINVSMTLLSGSKALCGETSLWTAEYKESVCHLLKSDGTFDTKESHTPCWLTLLKKA